MARAQAVVDLRAVSRTASQPVLDALAARLEPGAVTLADDDSIANGLRWVAAVVLIAGGVVAVFGMHVDRSTPQDRADGALGLAVIFGLGVWAALGPVRLYWRARRLPWRPAIYAIGPHVVDARTAKLRFFAIESVAAEVDGDRGAHRPCVVRVTSSWRTHAIRIKDRDVALRVRGQLSAPRGDVLAPLVAPTAAARPGDPGGAPREPLALRFAVVTAAIVGGIAGPLAVYL